MASRAAQEICVDEGTEYILLSGKMALVNVWVVYV